LVAKYIVPDNSELGRYRVLEVWVETSQTKDENRLVVRLDGPHVDIEPRVRIVGFELAKYRSIWSERGGPPYEVWAAPAILPDVLVLERDSKRIEIRRDTRRNE
jgi:hypothetical protein